MALTQTPARQTVLIIDDMPANVKLLSAYLERSGYSTVAALDGETGLRNAKLLMPDLIMLDVMMPELDGYEVCSRLKADPETREIPVLFMSSLGETQDKLAGFRAGGVDYLTKPFRMEEVLARVGTHLTLRRLQRQLQEQNRQLQLQITLQKKMEDDLQRAYDGLELRVAQRSADLVRVNESLVTENRERRHAEQRLHHMAHFDALTGLPNRVLMRDRISQALGHAHRSESRLALLFLDLDYFKHINDTLGHHAGDRLLQSVALRLQDCLREEDSVARMGGDEFVLCLPLTDGVEHSAIVAQKVLDALTCPFIVDGHEIHVGASIGISLYPENGRDVDSLMRAADTAMYHAKEKGRSGFQFFTSSLNKAAQRRVAQANRLRRALAKDDFSLHFQPQVDIETGRVFSCEALLRYRHGLNRLPISCGPFINVAEETGLIVPIGEWILLESCRQLRRWRDMGYTDLRIAVNFSARQCEDSNFRRAVENALADSGLPAEALNLELTESLLMQRSDENVGMLESLSEMGIRLSVDDFGTGYSSLAYLQRFPIHELKIDRSFVQGIGCNEGDTALVTAIISMARSLGLKVLAEGVETVQQANFLLSHGCPCAQGHLYSPALSAQAFTALLERGSRRASF